MRFMGLSIGIWFEGLFIGMGFVKSFIGMWSVLMSFMGLISVKDLWGER